MAPVDGRGRRLRPAHSAQEGRVHGTWANRGHAHARAPKFLGESLAVGQYEGLGSAVGGLPGGGLERDRGRDVEHEAASALEHAGQHGPGERGQGGAIHRDNPGLRPGVQIGVRAVSGDAGIVDQQINRTAADGGGERVNARRIGEIGRRELGRRCGRVEGTGDRAEAPGVAAGEQQPGLAGGKPPGDLCTDAGRGAGHNSQIRQLVRPQCAPSSTADGATTAQGQRRGGHRQA